MTSPEDVKKLIASPYEPDDPKGPKSGVAFRRWAVPVIAGVAGVAVAFAFLSSSPEPESADPATPIDGTGASLTPEDEVVFVAQEGFPTGFSELSDTVGIRPLMMYDIDGRTYITVASSVTGTSDAAVTLMDSVSRWEVETPSGTIAMEDQAANEVAPGLIQIGFESQITSSAATLVAHRAASSSTSTIVLIDGGPTSLEIEEPITVDADGVPIVIDSLFYNDIWGHFAWHSPTGVAATVEVIVSFLGTEGIVNDSELPLRMISFSSAEVFFGVEGDFDVPQWNTSGEESLDRHGPFRYDESTVESVMVEVRVSVVDQIDPPALFPLADLFASNTGG